MRIVRHRKLFICLLLVISITTFAWAQDNPGSIEKNVAKLSDHVYRIMLDFGLRPNQVLSAGGDGLLLVDTGHKDAAAHLQKALQEYGPSDLRYIINTHSHHDHAGANDISQDNTLIIGYPNLLRMAKEGVLTAGEGPILGRNGVVFPNYFRLDFNEEEIWILPHPGVHSDHDILVYFTRSKVVHMGDLLLSQSFPAVGPKVRAYIRVLDMALEAFPQDVTFVSGHGKELSHAGVRDYKQMLLDTVEIVKAGKQSGKSIEDLKREDVLAEYKDWAFYLEFLDTDYWIEAVYNSLR